MSDTIPATADIAAETSSVEGKDWVVIVDVIILVFTIIGSSSILINMLWREYKRRASTVRMRLVQGLVLSDFILGLVALIPSAQYLRGTTHLHGTAFCNGFGVLLVAVLFTEHFWTFFLALATFLILKHPLHIATRMLERAWYYLYILIWAISFGIAVLGYELYGYFPSGGICFYGNNSGLYGQLMQFIPRAIVFLAVVGFYSRLYVFLKRPDKIRASFSNSGGSDPETGFQQTSSHLSFRRDRKRSAGSSKNESMTALSRFSLRPRNRSAVEQTNIPQEKEDENSFSDEKMKAPRPVTSKDFAADEAIPGIEEKRSSQAQTNSNPGPAPWERMELPAFQIDGQRFGGSKGILSERGSNADLWGSWKGMVRGNRDPPTHRPTSPSAMSSGAMSPKTQYKSFAFASDIEDAYPAHQRLARLSQTPQDSRRTSVAPPNPLDSDGIGSPQSRSMSQSTGAFSVPDSMTHVGPSIPSLSLSGSLASSTSMHFPLLSPTMSQQPFSDPIIRRDSQQDSSETDSRRESEHGITGLSKAMLNPRKTNDDVELDDILQTEPPQTFSKSQKASQDESGDEEEIDFARWLAESYDDEDQPSDQRGRSRSETTELMEESTASYLNRKTALLMLYFPLAYILLFSVSLVRLIYAFGSSNEPAAFRAISRWLIFAQGVVDAVIYGFVEWNVKRIVRKKVRKGMLTPDGSRASHNSYQGATSDPGFRWPVGRGSKG